MAINQNKRISNALLRYIHILILPWILNCSLVGQEIREDIQKVVDSLEKIQYITQARCTNYNMPYNIKVKNQADFDALNEELNKAIKLHRNIQVNISKGVYYYKEDHLTLMDGNSDMNISIKGNRVTLISQGRGYSPNDKYRGISSPYNIFVDINTLNVFDTWGGVVRADSLIQIVDKDKKICRIPYSEVNDISEADSRLLYVRITQWFRSTVYKVIKIVDGYIYFLADNLSYVTFYQRKEYNVNYDYICGNQIPRFSLCNPLDMRKMFSLNDDTDNINLQNLHECQASRFLSIENFFCSSFSLSGIRFVGNAVASELIGINKSKFQKCIVSDCSFESIQGTVIKIKDADNICIEKNKFSNLYNYGIQVSNGSSNIEIKANTFRDCGLSVTNSFCIQCAAKNYYIANNTFCDFGYGAVGVGVYHGDTKDTPCTGIIEYNEMYYTPTYCARKEERTLMDSGAIYLWTQNDDAIIRYNYIHDIVGMRDNRGIFCDDGASNFKAYGNIIENTPNGYSIDSYRKSDQHNRFVNNINNFIIYNMIDHSIRFEGRDQNNNGCIKANNFIYCSLSDSYKTLFDKIERVDDDFLLENFYIKKGKLYIDKTIRNRVKNRYIFKHFDQLLCGNKSYHISRNL